VLMLVGPPLLRVVRHLPDEARRRNNPAPAGVRQPLTAADIRDAMFAFQRTTSAPSREGDLAQAGPYGKQASWRRLLTGSRLPRGAGARPTG
jgi:hypothetical protein